MPTKPSSPAYQSGSPLGPHLLRAFLFEADAEGSPGLPVTITDYGPLGHDLTLAEGEGDPPTFSTGGYGAPGMTLGATTLGAHGSDAGLPTGGGAWSATILVEDVGVDDYKTLYSRYGSHAGEQDQQIYIRNGHVVVASWNTLVEGSISVGDGAAHIIQVDYDGTTVTIRVDGVLDTSGAIAWAVPSSGSLGLCIGDEIAGSPNRPFPGLIDAVFIYDIARSAPQLAADLANPFAAVTPPVAASGACPAITLSAPAGTATGGSVPPVTTGALVLDFDGEADADYDAYIRAEDGTVWNGSAFEEFDAGNLADYALACSLRPGTTTRFLLVFPEEITDPGVYEVTVRARAGADPDLADAIWVTFGDIQWDGTRQVSRVRVAEKTDLLIATTVVVIQASPTPTTTDFGVAAEVGSLSTRPNAYKGSLLYFLDGDLAGQTSQSIKSLTAGMMKTGAFTAAPAAGDRAIILGKG